MTQIPNNAQFRADTTGVPIVEKGSNSTKSRSQFYTMQDIADSVASGSIAEHTYAELVAMAGDSELKAGSKYLMTDFQTLHIIPNTTDRNDTNKDIPVEPLLLTAISDSEFDIRAISLTYPRDIIHYDIDNESWGVLVDAGSMGKITRRIDTVNNVEVCQDWRNCVFRRWSVDISAYNGQTSAPLLWDTTVAVGVNKTTISQINLNAIDSADFTDYRMFNSGQPKNVKIENVPHFVNDYIVNTVFINDCSDCHLEEASRNTFNKAISHLSTTICHDNIFGVSGKKIANPGSEDYIHLDEMFSGSWFGNFITAPFHWDISVSNMIGCCMHYSPASWASSVSRMNGYFHYNRNVYLEINNTVGYSFVQMEYNRGLYLKANTNQVNGSPFKIIKFVGFNGDIEKKFVGTTSMIQIDTGAVDGAYYTSEKSTISRTVAAAANIPISITNTDLSNACGVFNLTGGSEPGTVVIGTIGSDIGAVRPPITLKPESGLTIQIVQNNVDYGVITNNQTYEANGAVDEVITLEWVYDRYYVTSGRIL